MLVCHEKHTYGKQYKKLDGKDMDVCECLWYKGHKYGIHRKDNPSTLTDKGVGMVDIPEKKDINNKEKKLLPKGIVACKQYQPAK